MQGNVSQHSVSKLVSFRTTRQYVACVVVAVITRYIVIHFASLLTMMNSFPYICLKVQDLKQCLAVLTFLEYAVYTKALFY